MTSRRYNQDFMKMAMGVALTLLVGGCTSMQGTGEPDLIIRNGRVVDGTGAPWFHGDVAVFGDTISAIGDLSKSHAKEIIDAHGQIVAPGFIDILGHSERSVLVSPRLEGKVRQGVTTELDGEGFAVAPINDALAAERASAGQNDPWRTLGEYMKHVSKQGTALNFAFLASTSNARLMTVGRADRPATEEEMEQMKSIVEGAMKDGAFGLSTALIYVPAVFTKTEELIELARVAARYGGSYFSHIRNEGDEVDSALEEAFRIGREANIPVNIWHLKIGGRHNWGKMPGMLEKIQQQRANGLDVAANVYPYIASSTALSALAPNWALEGGYSAFLKRLQDPALRKQIGEEISNSSFYHRLGDASGILVTEIPHSTYDEYQRKRLSEIATRMGVDPIEAALRLLQAGESSPGAIYFTMSEGDVQAALRTPWISVGSDSGAFVGDVKTEGAHPRGYGTFPRVIGHYVRDEHLFTLEEAVRKITSQAAARIQLQDRGILRPGMKADLVIFDPDRVVDVSTFEDPHHFSTGISDVIVNGVAVLRNGEMTGALPGRMLRKGAGPSL